METGRRVDYPEARAIYSPTVVYPMILTFIGWTKEPCPGRFAGYFAWLSLSGDLPNIFCEEQGLGTWP